MDKSVTITVLQLKLQLVSVEYDFLLACLVNLSMKLFVLDFLCVCTVVCYIKHADVCGVSCVLRWQ